MAQYELNLLDYWLILKKRGYTILITAALVIAFTFGMTQYLQPIPIYEASARVKFERATTVASLLLESIAEVGGGNLATQSEVIRSFQVIEQVARELKLVPENVTPEEKRSPEYLSIIYRLQQQIAPNQENSTSILRIAVHADTPEQAARLANSVAEAYRAENIKTRNRMVTETRHFVEDQVASIETHLREAEESLRDFKEREGQVFLSEEAKAALEAFTKLEQEYNQVLRLKDEVLKQINVLNSRSVVAGKAEERIFTEEPSAMLSVLNARLLDLQQERATLLINYTPEHPQVRELNRKIQNAKIEMSRELESKLKSLTGREAALKEQIDKYRDRYFGFPKAAIELTRLEREVKVNSDLYSTLKIKHQELLIKSAEQIEEVTIIEPAVPPDVPVNAPNNQVNMIVGVLMGAFLGLVLAFMRESFDTSIGTIEGVEEFLKLPVLGVIPKFLDKDIREVAAKALPPDVSPETLEVFGRLVCLYDPKSVLAEGFRSLRTNLQFASVDGKIKTLLFTSAGIGEGKTTTVVNLAITLAQDGKRVLLVDADLRRPVIHKRMGIRREPGLAEALAGAKPWRESVRTVEDLMLGVLGVDRVVNAPGLDNLNILTSGQVPPNASEFLNSKRMGSLLGEMREEYDVVLLDTPPILPIADAVMVSSTVDGTILVYQVGKVGRHALKRAKFLLDHAQAKILGVVLTNVRAEITPEYGYYKYDYR